MPQHIYPLKSPRIKSITLWLPSSKEMVVHLVLYHIFSLMSVYQPKQYPMSGLSSSINSIASSSFIFLIYRILFILYNGAIPLKSKLIDEFFFVITQQISSLLFIKAFKNIYEEITQPVYNILILP